MIKSLEDHSQGFYIPSHGMIYPALTYFEEIGFASVETEGARKRFSLTEAGRNHYGQNREVAARILSDLERIGAQMAQARQAIESGLVPEERESGAEGDELDAARRDLRGAQHKDGAYTAEDHGVADILNRAAAGVRRLLTPLEKPSS